MANFSNDFSKIKGVRGFKNIAKALARLEIMREPVLLNHAGFEAKKLQSILSDHPYHLHGSCEVYEFLVDDLKEGRLREIVNLLEPYRLEQGYALPVPAEYLLSTMVRVVGETRAFEELDVEGTKSLVYGHDWLRGDASILLRQSPSSIHTTTGFGRNIGIPASIKDKWRGGEYIEMGGSIGASAYEIKKTVGFSKCYSVDIMSHDRAMVISSIVDFEGKKVMPLTDELRGEFEKEINFVWEFDILKTPLSELGLGIYHAPLVLGLHNLLLYYTAKEKIVFNALSGIAGQTGPVYLWISSEGDPQNMIIEVLGDTIKDTIYA
jgi:hypothetical protein